MNEKARNEGGCPDEWTLSRFAENRLDEGAAGAVLEHVAGCARCRAKIVGLASWLEQPRKSAPSAEMREMARKTWLRMQWRRLAERLRPEAVVRAAADGQTGDQRQTKNAIGSGFIHFLSRTPRGRKDGWHVKLSIPSCPTEKTRLRMAVLDGTDEPVPHGTLHFCRIPVPVVDGHAVMALSDFQRNMDAAVISLCREDGADVPGDPVLGFDLMT